MQRTFSLKRTTEFRSPIFHSVVLTFTFFFFFLPSLFLSFSFQIVPLLSHISRMVMIVTIFPTLKRKKRNTHKKKKKKLSAVLSVIVHFQNSRMVTKVTVFPTVNRKRKKDKNKNKNTFGSEWDRTHGRKSLQQHGIHWATVFTYPNVDVIPLIRWFPM